MNEILLCIEIIIMFSLLITSKKIFGKNGLLVWIGIASILANIQVSKSINVFEISATLGNVMFASIFLATDILNECYSQKDAKKGVYIGTFSIIVYLICTQLTLLFTPNEIDITHNAMEIIFGLAPRVAISSIIMYYIANMTDVYLFEKLKTKKLWFRNNICTITCNCLENFGFVFMAFMGIYPLHELLIIAISTSILETIIAICDTPFLYIAKKIK